jgi:hypothetical protein
MITELGKKHQEMARIEDVKSELLEALGSPQNPRSNFFD